MDAEIVLMSLSMNQTEVTQQDPQDEPKSETSAALDAPVPMTAILDEPVDNSAGAELEVPYAETLPVIRPGAMGEGRVVLMQLLGLSVNHAFDSEVEDKIRERYPAYAGIVDAAVWDALQ